MKTNYLTFLIVILCATTSCSQIVSEDSADFAADMAEFITYNKWEQTPAHKILSDTIDLYVDYSTCVAEAMNSSYYRTVHPVIVDSNPNYYSIKGAQIKFETNNRQAVYQLLNTVREVNYADIKGAAKRIVEGNNHAVLITDGEYYQRKVGVLDSQTNPYLADEFRKWLNRGLDIYIYSEPYLESGKYNKFRYYFFFTDDNVDNNIQDRFQRSVPAQNNVKAFHLTSKYPTISKSVDYPIINQSLSPNTALECNGYKYDVQEYYTEWDDIYKYILDNAYDDKGNHIENGDYLVRGLFLDNNQYDGFRIKDLSINVTNVGEAFINWLSEKQFAEEVEDKSAVLPKAGAIASNNLLTYDKKLFNETGEIAIMLDKENKFEGLSTEGNLLKIDITANIVTENFTQNNDINGNFQWYSITNNNQLNTSIYESIRMVVLDPSMNPSGNNQNKILYTIYVSTYSL